MPSSALPSETLIWLFKQMITAECLTQVLEAAQAKKIYITRAELIQIFRNGQHREHAVSGSQFDLVQKKLNAEQELEQQLRQCKAQGMTWREAVFACHISPGPDYSRLRSWYEKFTARK